MKRVYKEVSTLDQRCYDSYKLSEDLLMEHAGLSLKMALPKKAERVLIVAGVGNNGADGIALARMLYFDRDVSLFLVDTPSSKMAKLQLERFKAIGAKEIDKIDDRYDVIIDCIFGSGLKRALDSKIEDLINRLNRVEAVKIACDIPTGILADGRVGDIVFKADITVTMGALKESLFGDKAKNFVGKVRVADLGVSHKIYEKDSDTYLLQKSDLKLPFRLKQDSHKGDFGHLAVVVGKKHGAGIIAASAAYAFGAGLVTVVENEPYSVPYSLMSSTTLPINTSAVCIGMGLGNQFDDECLKKFLFDHDKPIVVDADLFYRDILVTLLNKKSNLVLTPHPKEFASLLKMTGIGDVDVSRIQDDRFKYIRLFSKKYPELVIILKGANTLIAKGDTVYIQSFGTNALSKGGMGDVLSGFVASLLAQGYTPIDAAISASIAHALSAKKFRLNSYALTTKDIIEGVKSL